jgi:hypothetical protein
VKENRIRALDYLLQRCTQHDPKMRPAMATVVSELTSWLDVPTTLPQFDLSDLESRFVPAVQPSLRAEEERRQRIRAATELLSSFDPTLEALKSSIQNATQLDPTFSRGSRFEKMFGIPGTYGGARRAWVGSRAIELKLAREISRYLWLGVVVEVLESDRTFLTAFGFTGYGVFDNEPSLDRGGSSEHFEAQLDTTDIASVQQQTEAWLRENVRPLMESFLEAVAA